jgi:Ca2+-binding RTX toxin-like protein
MPTFIPSQGIQNPITALDNMFKTLFGDNAFVSGTDTTATFQRGQLFIELTGDAFVFAGTGAQTELVGGTLVSAFLPFFRSGYDYSVSDLDLDIATVVAAAALEEAGTDMAALESLIYPLDWTLHGNSTSESILKTQLSFDGVPVAFSGNNTVWLEYGHDRFHAGAGNDTVHGGWLDDVLWGGMGRDILYGERDNDTLYGGLGHDRLLGGVGSDSLHGGRGKDVLNGGQGNDDLYGGMHADRFVFYTAMRPEVDTIHDFEIVLDRIVLRSGTTPTLTETADGVDIADGLRVIHVLGITADDLDSSNLLIPSV